MWGSGVAGFEVGVLGFRRGRSKPLAVFTVSKSGLAA